MRENKGVSILFTRERKGEKKRGLILSDHKTCRGKKRQERRQTTTMSTAVKEKKERLRLFTIRAGQEEEEGEGRERRGATYEPPFLLGREGKKGKR